MKQLNMKKYKELESYFYKIGVLESISSILYWDKEVIMPENAIEERSKQMELLSSEIHERITNSELVSMVSDIDEQELNNWEIANLRQIKKSIDINSCLSNDLVKRLTKAIISCTNLWKVAKSENNFDHVKNSLSQVIELTKEVAERKGQKFGVSHYNALLDNYDPGRTSSDIDKIFSDLEPFLKDLITKVEKKQGDKPSIMCHYPIDQQKELVRGIISELGFDFNGGVFGTSTHPFCGGTSSDSRMTTRYHETDIKQSVYGAIHETGHAIYNKNLPQKFLYQPVGYPLGMTLHESQSLLFEYHMGLNKCYASKLFKKIKNNFSAISFTEDDFFKNINYVERSFIRVDADEVTYFLHVIIRYKIEKQLIEGEINVDDIPAIWNELYEKILGITPKNDSVGCMQDIHWYSGNFGYFPSYALGATLAAQIRYKISNEIGGWDSYINDLNIAPIVNWLNSNVHKCGSYFQNVDELLLNNIGEKLNQKYLKDYLLKKYL